MKKIYVCSRYAGETDENVKKAREYCGFVAKVCGAVPVAPHIYFTQFLDDAVPEQRTFGRMVGLQLLSECDELWYFGDQITRGMTDEICFAIENGISVRYVPEHQYEKYLSERKITNEIQL